MRPTLVLAGWLAFSGLQAMPVGDSLEKRQSAPAGGGATPPPAADPPATPAAGAGTPPPADTPAPAPNTPAPAPNTPAPAPNTPPPADPTPAPAPNTPAAGGNTPAPADPTPANPSAAQPTPAAGTPVASPQPQPQSPAPTPQPQEPTPTPQQPAVTPTLVPAPDTPSPQPSAAPPTTGAPPQPASPTPAPPAPSSAGGGGASPVPSAGGDGAPPPPPSGTPQTPAATLSVLPTAGTPAGSQGPPPVPTDTNAALSAPPPATLVPSPVEPPSSPTPTPAEPPSSPNPTPVDLPPSTPTVDPASNTVVVPFLSSVRLLSIGLPSPTAAAPTTGPAASADGAASGSAALQPPALGSNTPQPSPVSTGPSAPASITTAVPPPASDVLPPTAPPATSAAQGVTSGPVLSPAPNAATQRVQSEIPADSNSSGAQASGQNPPPVLVSDSAAAVPTTAAPAPTTAAAVPTTNVGAASAPPSIAVIESVVTSGTAVATVAVTTLLPPPSGTAAAVPTANSGVASASVAVIETVVTSGTQVATIAVTTLVFVLAHRPLCADPQFRNCSEAVVSVLSSQPVTWVPADNRSSAIPAEAYTTVSIIGEVNTKCKTSAGLNGKIIDGGCFADPGQDCTVSDGIPGATSDKGTCAPVVGVGAACTLSDGTKGTTQLQGLGTSLSCIGAGFAAGSRCFLPFGVVGTIDNDGKTCNPPKLAPPAGDGCPVPGFSALGVMQADGKTCLPPPGSTPASGAGGGGDAGSGGGLSNSAQCAVGGQPGTLDNGSCRAVVPRAGDPCYRGGGGAFFSNAPPDGILGPDLSSCLIVNDTCNANGVQGGRWSPSYRCELPPLMIGNPAQDGAVCQRGGMWGGRWNAANSSCILPGDPCPAGIYGPNAVDCIAKPASGTGCQTAQGFNGTYSDAGLCVAIIPPGNRTPCLSVNSEAGAVSITPNGTLCQIAPTPDTPLGLFRSIAPGTYCSNGRDAGEFTDVISCAVQQRPGGLSELPVTLRGNPYNDISSLQSVAPRKSSKKNWIPGVATAAAVVVAAVVLLILAKYCGWFGWCERKRRQRHEPPAFGPGEGILEETTYGPQPSYPTVGGAQYRGYNVAPLGPTSPTTPTMTATTLTAPATNRLSVLSDDQATNPFAETNYNTHPQQQWDQDSSAFMETPHHRPLSQPDAMPPQVADEPLLAGYTPSPPSYPAQSHTYNDPNNSPFR